MAKMVIDPTINNSLVVLSFSHPLPLKQLLFISSISVDTKFDILIPSSVIHMSYPCIEIICGKCGSIINKIISLKSVRDVLRPSNNRCGVCGNALNPSDFAVELHKQ